MGIISGGQVMPSDGMTVPFEVAGAPAANFGAGIVRIGAQYINITNGVRYTCTATNGTTTATWAVVGAQT
jgi:hypothetical protein